MDNKKIGIPLEGFAEFTRKVVAEGAVLLQNTDQVLPLVKEDRISIFGRTQINFYRSGTGSGGAVNVDYTVNLLEGLRNTSIPLNEDLVALYEKWVEENPFDNGGGGWAAEPWHQKEMSLSEDLVKDARDKSNKAIIVIGRTAGEDKDNAGVAGSYLLTEEEKEMLSIVSKYFEDTIVVLNVSNIIDMKWINDNAISNPVKGIIYVWQGGVEGGNAVADVLTGKISPSGKLTDTIAYDLQDYPSTQNYGNKLKNLYQEDIYVGYRYFETFAKDKVQYPFGFGLSYTNFTIESMDNEFTIKEEQPMSLKAKVTNIGEQFAGKEVVQVYMEAPQGKLGKPSKVLVGFTKTDLLAPGESQVVDIRIDITNMASYDDKGITGQASRWVLEAGAYVLYVGNSVRECVPMSLNGKLSYTLDELIVIEQLDEAMAPLEEYTRFIPGAKNLDGTYQLAYEDVPRRSVDLAKRIEENIPALVPQTGNLGIKLKDVASSNATMDAFIGQLSDVDLAMIVRGEGMSSPKVTQGTASAFGGVGDSLLDYGIPVACTADGPSGIRMEGGLKATQLPIGTLQAATWNLPLIEELYEWEGKEMVRNNIDTLLGPGMNLRRSPLNGRNFEYFSEDPLITGEFAAATTLGIRKGGSHATLKHFACNNQEKDRSFVDAVVSERALREIYLRGFEIAVKKGKALSIMTSYNPINGHWAASNYDLNTTVLRKQWGFEGIVMTDWWAKMNDVALGGEADVKNTRDMVRAQNDLYMVVSNNGAEVNAMGDNTKEALENGSLTIAELQQCAKNICNFIIQTPVFSREENVVATVKQISARELVSTDSLHALAQDSKVQVEMDRSSYIHVENKGVYDVLVKLMSPMANISQTASNIIMNDEVLSTLQTNGTDGRWIVQKLLRVELNEGLYELKVELLKAGMVIEWIEFISC